MSTSITLDTDVKDALESYRHPEHESWSETFHAVLDVVPTPAEIREDGCTNSECDSNVFVPDDAPIDEIGGVIQWLAVEYDGETLTDANWFCSAECVQEAQERMNDMAGQNPEKVVVGGKDAGRVTLPDADFYLDGQRKEVSIDLPGVFGGEDSHGNEYGYVGEPVYVYNRGRVVQSGVVDQIIHEDFHTALLLEDKWAVDYDLDEYEPDD